MHAIRSIARTVAVARTDVAYVPINTAYTSMAEDQFFQVLGASSPMTIVRALYRQCDEKWWQSPARPIMLLWQSSWPAVLVHHERMPEERAFFIQAFKILIKMIIFFLCLRFSVKIRKRQQPVGL